MTEPPPDYYIRWVTHRSLMGMDVSFPIEPEAEPTNIVDIRAARTQRATALLMRGRVREETF
jgi:hypothetical protein